MTAVPPLHWDDVGIRYYRFQPLKGNDGRAAHRRYWVVPVPLQGFQPLKGNDGRAASWSVYLHQPA